MSKENEHTKLSSNTLDRNASKVFFNKSRSCPICSSSAKHIDYKNPDLLKDFVSKGGRMLPSRVTNTCSRHQRSLKKAIKHSRVLSLLPFVLTHR